MWVKRRGGGRKLQVQKITDKWNRRGNEIILMFPQLLFGVRASLRFHFNVKTKKQKREKVLPKKLLASVRVISRDKNYSFKHVREETSAKLFRLLHVDILNKN
jgi:hypothetical protein